MVIPSACRSALSGTETASSLGFRPAALTFLNQPAVVADVFRRLDANVGMGS